MEHRKTPINIFIAKSHDISPGNVAEIETMQEDKASNAAFKMPKAQSK